MRYGHRYSPHRRATIARSGRVFRYVRGMTFGVYPLVLFINTPASATLGTKKDIEMTQLHGEPAQSSGSLRLEEPAALVGRWIVATQRGDCAVDFTARRIDSANAWAVEDATGCLTALAPGVVGWRPTPDGIALASADRRTVVLFATGADGWSATLSGDPATLRKG